MSCNFLLSPIYSESCRHSLFATSPLWHTRISRLHLWVPFPKLPSVKLNFMFFNFFIVWSQFSASVWMIYFFISFKQALGIMWLSAYWVLVLVNLPQLCRNTEARHPSSWWNIQNFTRVTMADKTIIMQVVPETQVWCLVLDSHVPHHVLILYTYFFFLSHAY